MGVEVKSGGESKPRATGPDGSFTANTEISI